MTLKNDKKNDKNDPENPGFHKKILADTLYISFPSLPLLVFSQSMALGSGVYDVSSLAVG